jgi:hypothetical protein
MVKTIIAVIAAAAIAAVAVGLIPPPEPAVAAIETGAPTLGASNLGASNLAASNLGTTTLAAPSLAAAAHAAVTPSAAAVETEKGGCTQAWPYYEQSCLHSNSRQRNGNARVVRVIANDRSVADRALRARR